MTTIIYGNEETGYFTFNGSLFDEQTFYIGSVDASAMCDACEETGEFQETCNCMLPEKCAECSAHIEDGETYWLDMDGGETLCDNCVEVEEPKIFTLATFYMLPRYQQRQRENGEKYWCAPNANTFLSNINSEIHEGSLPDDFTYETIVDTLKTIQHDCTIDDDVQSIREAVEESIDSENYDSYILYNWLSQNNNSEFFCDKAISEFQPDTFNELIDRGYRLHKQNVADDLITLLATK